MKTFIIVMLIFGVAEIISNSIHLLKGSKIKIGESAKKQHQELPLNVDVSHFYYKAVIMFLIGILFLVSSIIFLFFSQSSGILFTFINTAAMSIYGLIQLIIYYKTIKVWTAFIVYTIPLIVCIITN